MEVLAAVQGRTAKGLTQVYQSFFRLEQLGMGVVTPNLIYSFFFLLLQLNTLVVLSLKNRESVTGISP